MSLRYGRHSADGAQPTDGDEQDEQGAYPAEVDPADAPVTGSAATDGTYTDRTESAYTDAASTDSEADVPTRPTFTAKTDAPSVGSVPEPTPAPDDDTVPDGAMSYDTPSSYGRPSFSAVDVPPTESDLAPATGLGPDDGAYAGTEAGPVAADVASPAAQSVPAVTALDTPAQAQSAPSTVVSRDKPLLSDVAGLRDRWQQVQAEFVDDPRDAVSGAADLIEQTTQTLVNALQQRQRDLRTAFEGDNSGTATADGAADTERLRLMMQRYRALFNQLTQV